MKLVEVELPEATPKMVGMIAQALFCWGWLSPVIWKRFMALIGAELDDFDVERFNADMSWMKDPDFRDVVQLIVRAQRRAVERCGSNREFFEACRDDRPWARGPYYDMPDAEKYRGRAERGREDL